MNLLLQSAEVRRRLFKTKDTPKNLHSDFCSFFFCNFVSCIWLQQNLWKKAISRMFCDLFEPMNFVLQIQRRDDVAWSVSFKLNKDFFEDFISSFQFCSPSWILSTFIFVYFCAFFQHITNEWDSSLTFKFSGFFFYSSHFRDVSIDKVNAQQYRAMKWLQAEKERT